MKTSWTTPGATRAGGQLLRCVCVTAVVAASVGADDWGHGALAALTDTAKPASGGDIFGFGSVDKIKSSAGGGGAASDTTGLPPARRLVFFVNVADTTCALRSLRWGMTQAQVKAAEKVAPSAQAPSSLTYRLRNGDLTASISCLFSSDKLSAAHCVLRQPLADPAACYRDFEDLTLYLCRTFGTPKIRDYVWKDRTCENDRGKWGLALAKGWLVPRLVWETAGTVVDLTAKPSGQQLVTTVSLSAVAAAAPAP